MDVTTGRLIAPRPGTAYVRLVEGGVEKTVLAANTLGIRLPVNAKVVVARDQRKRYRIVGWERQ